MAVIRRLAQEDIPALVEKHGVFMRTAGYDFDAPSFQSFIDRAMGLDTFVFFGSFGSDGALNGILGGLLSPIYFNESSLLAQELFWWVDPSARKGGVGSSLLQAFEAWAHEVGARAIVMATVQSLDPEVIGAFYERNNYRSVERNYMKGSL